MHTKILLRTLTFNLRYQQWTENNMNVHLEMLRGSYANEVFGTGSSDLAFEESAVYSRITWSPEELRIEDLDFMMDYLQAVMLKNNYYLNLSDERNEVYDSGLKMTVHRHYLKPLLSTVDISPEKAYRRFGNIFMEHRFNNRLNSLCISANYYGKNKYLSFEKLMEILLG
jgi:hypothetical protein